MHRASASCRARCVGVASKRKPYWSLSAATLRVNVLRLLAHQKPAPSFSSNGSTCFGSRLPCAGCDGQVAVEDVVDLGAVFQEEAVADALVADAVADDEVVRAVDREPAVVAVPDRGADDGAAAHRVAAQVEVQA